MKPAYVLITPARNEETHIEKTLQSVISQTVLPKKWVIVSDGSTDATDQIVDGYARKYKFIELVRRDSADSRNFSSKVYAFREGLARLGEVDYEFIGNLDADIWFNADYFERILERMHRYPEVGIGGGLLLEKLSGKWVPQIIDSQWSVSGAVQLFRCACFEAIGVYEPTFIGIEDAVAEVRARMKGWQVRTFTDTTAFHHRLTSTENRGILSARLHQGRSDFMLGCHPLFEVAKCVKRIREKPRIIGAIIRLLGYSWARINREPHCLPIEVADYLKREQLRRLLIRLRGPV